MHKKTFTALFFILAIIIFLTGCEELHNKDEMKKELLEIYPKSTVIRVKETQTQEENDMIVYSMQNDDIAFKVYDYLYQDNVSGFTRNDVYSDYYIALYQYKEDEVYKIIRKYEIPTRIMTDEETTFINVENEEFFKSIQDTDMFYCDFDIRTKQPDNALIYIRINIENKEQLNAAMKLLDDLYELVEEYIPEHENEEYCDEALVSFSEADRYFYGLTFPINKNNRDFCGFEDWVEYCYQGENARYQTMYNLEIDGELVDKNESVRFYYNPAEKTYYIPVAFNKTDERSSSAVNLIAILEEYQDDVDLSKYEKNRTYKIGKDKYQIDWQGIKVDKDTELIIRKNNKTLKMEVLKSLYRYYSYRNERYLSVHDFAELLGMEIDEINQEDRTIRLTTD